METIIQGNRDIKGVIAGNDTMALGADGGAQGRWPREGDRRRLRRQPRRHPVDQGGRDQGDRAAAGGAHCRAGGRAGAPAHHHGIDRPAGEAVDRLRARHPRQRRRSSASSHGSKRSPKRRRTRHGQGHARRHHRQPRLLSRRLVGRSAARPRSRSSPALDVDAVMLGEDDTKLGGGGDLAARARRAPTCSPSTATASTASSCACRTSATRRAWPTR